MEFARCTFCECLVPIYEVFNVVTNHSPERIQIKRGIVYKILVGKKK